MCKRREKELHMRKIERYGKFKIEIKAHGIGYLGRNTFTCKQVISKKKELYVKKKRTRITFEKN